MVFAWSSGCHPFRGEVQNATWTTRRSFHYPLRLVLFLLTWSVFGVVEPTLACVMLVVAGDQGCNWSSHASATKLWCPPSVCFPCIFSLGQLVDGLPTICFQFYKCLIVAKEGLVLAFKLHQKLFNIFVPVKFVICSYYFPLRSKFSSDGHFSLWLDSNGS